MNLKWSKQTDTHLEAYLGPWHVITLIKEGEFWKWYSELPFSTTKYSGRRFGKHTSPKRAALEAQRSTEEWLSAAGLTQSTK